MQMTREEIEAFKTGLAEKGEDVVRANLLNRVYNEKKRELAQQYVDDCEAERAAGLQEEELDIARDANTLAEESNRIARAANRTAAKANRIAEEARTWARWAVIVAGVVQPLPLA
jgi:hypothetical protein